MKKKVLTLAVCLALTATTTLVCSATTVTKKTAIKPVACTTKVATPKAETVLTPEQQAKKKFQERIAKDRANLYCTLGLTDAQKAKAAELNQKQDAKAEPIIEKINAERCKLNELKAKNASEDEINKQKKEIKKVRKELKENFKAAQKDFEAILTKDQLAKLNAIKEERKNCRCKNLPKDAIKNDKKDDCKLQKPHRHHGFGFGFGSGCGCKKTDVTAPQNTTPVAPTAPVTPTACPVKK